MVKKTKGKHRLDKFYHLAKEQGYRSRAAFKLIQLNRKYDFLSGARTLLDLCAAPGGWCQVAVKNMPVGSLILGVDLAPIKPIRGVKTFIGDITTQKCRQQVRKESGGQLIDVVLHDGAPNVGGAWSSEAYSQSWLVLEALRMATDVLAPKGTFVTKVFRSKDYSALLYALNQLFNKVEATKPAASRNASAEIFVVCQGFKAPAKIDPRLLDAKYIFEDVQEAPRTMGPDALLKQKVKQKRWREGYEEGISISRKVGAAAAFVASDAPVEMLGQMTALALDGGASEDVDIEGLDDVEAAAALIRSHPATTDEIRLLCSDLQVLGRSEFKQLLKWRLLVKKELIKAKAAAEKAEKEAAGDTAAVGSDDEAEEGGKAKDKAGQLEEQLLEEMEEIKDRLDRRRKREKRRRRELKTKARLRTAQLAQGEGIGEDDVMEGLFSLTDLRSKRDADAAADADAPSDGSDSDSDSGSGGSSEDLDSDEERLRYEATMDEYLEESYQSWKVRQRMKDAGGGVVKKRRRRLGMGGELDSDEEGEGAEEKEESESSSEEEVEEMEESESEEEEEEEEEEGGGLIVSLDGHRAGRSKDPAAATNQWFAQDLFDDADLEDEEEEGAGNGVAAAPAARRQQQQPKAKRPAPAAVTESESDEEEEDGGGSDEEMANGATAAAAAAASDSDADADEEEDEEAAQMRRATGYGFSADDLVDPSSKKERAGFEEVPMSDSDDGADSGAEEFEALDDEAKAEVRALAKKFLRKKAKDDIMEAAYNRWAFHDEGLPQWFKEDEKKFMRPPPPITSDEYKQARDELKAIDARPIKKIAEAKARKRKRLVSKLTQARQKAESIANQEDVPMKAKMREIEKVYAKARAAGGVRSGVRKKGSGSRSDQYKKKGPPLDSRMKKDKRGLDAAARRNKAKGRGGGGSRGGGGGGKRR